ncbi:hypothetical protein AJ80_04421 [Polytolypa hystricis UAMH7299]|uniref:DNA-directed RNA polymerase I subunit RPA34.5 n=1 Tax=Polytolypa hystricis (strain UAMH7299) TaxID=1447883 RepID=A0A2B7YCB6_POLH7|nr:hypothetical protein AJ80_04421 [Polytolypa hystricis UAMH7299]
MAPPLSKEVVSDNDVSDSESSSSESVSVKEVSHKPKDKTTSTAKKAKKAEKRQKTPEPSSSESSSEEAESESEEESREEPVKETSTKSKKKVTIQEKEVEIPPSIPTKEFTPPGGFRLAQKSSSRAASDIPKLFSNLRRKQIWHITAPASVPVSSIQELALDTVAKGESILTHKGVGYRMREDLHGVEKNKALLLPDERGKTYRRNQVGVAQTFHVEQVIELSNGTAYSGEAEGIQKLMKPRRRQPKNLRMRYMPFGAGEDASEAMDHSSEESEAEKPTFKVPTEVHVDGEAKKRKHKEVEPIAAGSDNEQGERRKKVKKAHSERSKHHAEADGALPSIAEKEVPVRGREEERSKSGHRSSKKHRDETSQERRARREERKRKKQGL